MNLMNYLFGGISPVEAVALMSLSLGLLVYVIIKLSNLNGKYNERERTATERIREAHRKSGR